MFEEYEEQFKPKYGDKRGLVERVFSSNPEPMLGQKIKQQAPALYKALQGKAQEAGLIGETQSQWVQRLAEVKKPAPPKLLDADEQIARSINSEQEVDRILAHQGAMRDAKGQLTVSPDNLVQMRKHEPQKDYYVRLAAYSYGKLLTRPVKPTAETKSATQQAETFELASDLCGKFNVAPGTHVSLEQFADLSVKHHDKVKAEAERVAAEAVAAEGAAR